jgi:hypothetical protein
MLQLLKCRVKRCLIAALTVALAFFRMSAVNAFIPSHRTPPQHHLAGFLGKKFDGIASDNSESSDQTGARGEIVEEIDGFYTGSKRIITIPGKLKV